MKNIIRAILIIILFAFTIFAQEDKAIFYQELSWSPDGKYLSFTGMRDLNTKPMAMKADIYIIKSDGTQSQKVTDDLKNEFYSSWSKDSKRIVFGGVATGSKESDIYSIKMDGTDLIQLTKNAGRNATPAFSPDGNKIAFISNRDGEKYQIYVMNVDGTNVKRLTNDSTMSFYNPIWSPDGKKIVYYSEKSDRKDQICVMNADGSNQTLLTGGIGHNIFPAWSADGKKIIFSSSNRDTVDGSYIEGSYLYLMNADGSNLKKLGNINSFFARFSPDGKKIAFISGKFPNSNIFIANADGTNQAKLTQQ